MALVPVILRCHPLHPVFACQWTTTDPQLGPCSTLRGAGVCRFGGTVSRNPALLRLRWQLDSARRNQTHAGTVGCPKETEFVSAGVCAEARRS